jgi:formylglycine-generating enzyme required for sulfatase activity
MGRFEVTVHEFELFLRATGHKPAAECRVHVGLNQWVREANASWKWPNYDQAPDHPVACVSWHDARKYADWLSRRTGKKYRLPTEAEWEYAARAESETARPWGESAADACDHANVADQKARLTWKAEIHPCNDRAAFTSAVGSYAPNAFGLYDMIGNVWEWVEDCLTPSYADAPATGVAVAPPECRHRVLRGGAWHTEPKHARSAQRGFQEPDHGYYSVGFRLVRER